MTRRLPVLLAAALLPLGVLGFWGCSSSAPNKGEATSNKASADDPQALLDTARAHLRTTGEESSEERISFSGPRAAVEAMNPYVQALKKEDRPSFRLKDRAALKEWFHLSDDELTELESPTFTALDGYYLGTCLQLADAVHSLDVQGRNRLDRARAGFAWVVRQVTLLERTRPSAPGREDDLLPPSTVLILAQGTARERALVFLELLRQMQVDGCMIACPGEGGRPAVWIPGALVPEGEKDTAGRPVPAGIYLFDTRLGIPLPGPGGKGVARLDQVMKDPQAIRSLFGKDLGDRIVPQNIARAEVLLACPLSALSPRMPFLEKHLTAGEPVVLALDAGRQRERFRKATTARVGFWSDAEDPNTPTRVLRATLSPTYGGTDPNDRANKEVWRFIPWPLVRERFPRQVQRYPALSNYLGSRIEPQFMNFYLTPRTLMLRGRFDQATEALVRGQDAFRHLDALLQQAAQGEEEQAFSQEVDEWVQKLLKAQLRLAAAEDAVRGKNGGGPEAQRARKEAQDQLNALFKDYAALVQLLGFQAAGKPLRKESTYLLCLCMQEKAERMQTRQGRMAAAGQGARAVDAARDNARTAWESARGWWLDLVDGILEPELTREAPARKGESGPRKVVEQRIQEVEARAAQGVRDPDKALTALASYEALAQDLSRLVSARLLLARAQEQSGQRAAAVEQLQELHDELGRWEKTGVVRRIQELTRVLPVFRPTLDAKGRPVREAVAYASPETLTWLRASLSFQLGQLKAK